MCKRLRRKFEQWGTVKHYANESGKLIPSHERVAETGNRQQRHRRLALPDNESQINIREGQ